MARWARLIPLLLFLVVVPVLAQNPPISSDPSPILVVEVQTGSTSSATEEFIELINRTNEPYSVDEIKLQYHSASGSEWITKTQLDGDIEPRGRYLIATDYLADQANVTTALGLAGGGGHIRLVELGSGGESELDRLSWGAAQFPLVAAAVPPAAGQSLKRLIDEDGQFVDTDDDSRDFIVSLAASPESTPPITYEPTELEQQTPQPTDPGEIGEQAPPTNPAKNARSFAKLEITELFIDPDQPLTDADDEFVELYNPTGEAVDLEDYIIETGMNFSYDFVIPNITLAAKQYLAFYALDTGLALSNSGGGARLLSPDKTPIYETPPYEKAKPDTVWANIAGVWQWSAKPTPNAPNAAAGTASGSGFQSGAGGRTYLNRGRTLAATEPNRSIYEEPPIETSNQIDTAVVAGVGAMALLYAGNEYRYDIGNFVQKLKRYLASRRGGGATA